MATLVIKENEKYLSFTVKGNDVFMIHRQKGEIKIGTIDTIAAKARKRNAKEVFLTHTCNNDFNMMNQNDIKAITIKTII